MTGPQTNLEHECRTFTRYLADREPDRYLIEKYVAGNQELALCTDLGRADRGLVETAATHVLLARFADAYARFFASESLLRRKLVLLLAILESTAPYSRKFDATQSASKLSIGLRLLVDGVTAALCVLIGSLIFFPQQAVLKMRNEDA